MTRTDELKALGYELVPMTQVEATPFEMPTEAVKFFQNKLIEPKALTNHGMYAFEISLQCAIDSIWEGDTLSAVELLEAIIAELKEVK